MIERIAVNAMKNAAYAMKCKEYAKQYNSGPRKDLKYAQNNWEQYLWWSERVVESAKLLINWLEDMHTD